MYTTTRGVYKMEQKSNCKKCQDRRDCYVRMLIRNGGVPPLLHQASESDIRLYNDALDHKCALYNPED
jgi:positive regulator of sigma E activity